jgi:hypothetical protein
MSDDIKKGIIAAIVILILIDASTTMIGLATIFQPSRSNPLSFLFCLGPALAVMVLLVLTQKIWQGNTPIHRILQGVWFVALGYDVYTSFRANVGILTVGLRGLVERFDVFEKLWSLRLEVIVAVLIATLLISSAPILLPYIAGDHL